MDGATTLLSSGSHFSIASKDFLPQAYHTAHGVAPGAARKRKPVVTYQSPGSGIVDVGLLVRNTALEIEAAAARAVPVHAQAPAVAVPAPVVSLPAPAPPPAPAAGWAAPHSAPALPKVESAPAPARVGGQRPITIPRPPRPLYHPLSRPIISKAAAKVDTTASSSTSQLAPPTEPGRRSSSRTRRPAPKMRDSESLASAIKAAPEKPSPVRRRRGPAAGGKRKRGAAQLDVDGDGTYPAAKRTRKPRERAEMDVDETMPPPSTNGASPPSGYSTRAKRPRKAPARAESSTSDGTGSATRTTPVNGQVEEFWVPTKST